MEPKKRKKILGFGESKNAFDNLKFEHFVDFGDQPIDLCVMTKH